MAVEPGILEIRPDLTHWPGPLLAIISLLSFLIYKMRLAMMEAYGDHLRQCM